MEPQALRAQILTRVHTFNAQANTKPTSTQSQYEQIYDTNIRKTAAVSL